MFGNTNQNKKNQKESEDKGKNTLLAVFNSKDGKSMIQQMASNQALIGEKIISQDIFLANQNKSVLDMCLSFKACNHLSKLDLSIFNMVWPGLNSGQSVKLLPLGATSENANNNDINKKASLIETANKIKNKIENEKESDKDQTNLHNDPSSFEK